MEFVYSEQVEKDKIMLHRFNTLVPADLYGKFYDSRISREIFFIDAYRDLRTKIKNGKFYDLIRASGILRQLLLDKNNKGIDTSLITLVGKAYGWSPKYTCTTHEIQGTPFSSNKSDANYVAVIKKKKFDELFSGSLSSIKLTENPIKEYFNEDFLQKNCIVINFSNKENIVFSVHNVIYLVANFNGGIHVDPLPEISTLESFHMGEFNPLVLNEKSEFIKRISEICIIVLESLRPLVFLIAKNLHTYNKQTIQIETSGDFYVIKDEAEAKAIFGKQNEKKEDE